MKRILEAIDMFLLRRFQACCDFLERRLSLGTATVATCLFHALALSVLANLFSGIFMEGRSVFAVACVGLLMLNVLWNANHFIGLKRNGALEDIEMHYRPMRLVMIVFLPTIYLLNMGGYVAFIRTHHAWTNACFITGQSVILMYFLFAFFISCTSPPDEENDLYQ